MQEETREKLRQQTVAVLLTVRNEYLSAGANPLKHWDQIQDRLRSAARTSADVPEWVTKLSRSLGLASPSRARCSATDTLAGTVRELACAGAWLDLVEDEHGYLMAMTMLEADKRRAAREAEKTAEFETYRAEADAAARNFEEEENGAA